MNCQCHVGDDNCDHESMHCKRPPKIHSTYVLYGDNEDRFLCIDCAVNGMIPKFGINQDKLIYDHNNDIRALLEIALRKERNEE